MIDVNRKEEKIKEAPGKSVDELLRLLSETGRANPAEEKLFREVRSGYRALTDREKEALFRRMTEEIEISDREIRPVLQDLLHSGARAPDWPAKVSKLRRALIWPRLEIFRRIARSPGGLKFLLDFRGDLLSVQRFSRADLFPLDADIRFLFEIWFQEGFLFLEEITLDSSYRQIELIKDSDLVHPMTGIEEMGQRLGRDRRCFALYHRVMPYEPIVFIEVALTRGIVGNIQDIINADTTRTDEKEADTAVFYSINNTQHGLTGLGLGKILIGQVVDHIRKKNERIRRFATLSPLPGFWNHYLRPLLEGGDENFELKSGEVRTFFSRKVMNTLLSGAETGVPKTSGLNRALLHILSGDAWVEDPALVKSLRDPLVRIAYHYVAREKNPRGKPLNPVANFHLANGATVSQRYINFLANTSARGLRESCGIMVNYIYSTTWLNQLRKSLRWFDRMEIRGLFGRGK